MIRKPFNDDWRFNRRTSVHENMIGGGDTVTVTLPHDAVLTGGRSADSPEGPNTGYFRPGTWQYEKTFDVPASWATKRVTFEFEGVYRDAMVFVNDAFAGQWANGYSTFHIAADPYLRYGQANSIRVEAQAYKDSRWYSGGGIHRPVHLLVGELLHITPAGMRVTTPEIDDELAVVMVATEVDNEGIGTRSVDVDLEIRDSHGAVVATDHGRVTVLAGERMTVRQRAYVRHPALWGPETPHLHSATVRLTDEDGQVDEARTSFGIRSLSLDPVRGLRINGKTVKLRGACVHNDNGVLGAATIDRAEERRVRLLRAAGFNAIRAAHHPMSRAMLEVCDRLGMIVMDETFDVWSVSKTDDDYSRRFPQWWQRDVDALVAKDFNHPSVVFYSIGNEIPEAGTPHGARWARLLAERVREQDPTRLVTNAINGMSAVKELVPGIMARVLSPGAADGASGEGNASEEGTGFNDLLGQFSEVMSEVIGLPEVGERIVEDASLLDVVGLNYGDSRYLIDREAFPDRVIVGSETFPSLIERYWELVSEHSHIIGDFTWTGWDYLGEPGIGRPIYPGEDNSLAAPFPWLTANTGDFDITGRRRPISYYREVVFGLRHTPYLAVQRPEYRHHPVKPHAWTWTDSVADWTWDIRAGTTVTVEAYTDADEIEFLVNGTVQARVPVGGEKAFVATADLRYEPGTVEAVAYRSGEETGRVQLRTAAEPSHVRLHAEDGRLTTGDQDLLFLDIALVDANGTVNPLCDRTVTVDIEGPAVLQGLGSARPSTEEFFLASTCTTHEGQALAVIRPTGEEGTVTITVGAEGLQPAVLSRRPHTPHATDTGAHDLSEPVTPQPVAGPGGRQ
ncbi:glycoside hydrolase family 2 TIM barrel-domain containing protein [Streptomyces sp. NPDC020794]|uniref:glycoside hydrolase family 2 TIM barrel-domain containing protein n=1 Tax=unclassified Streptomyces TaxID=2593676 RepID=UPI0036EBCD28